MQAVRFHQSRIMHGVLIENEHRPLPDLMYLCTYVPGWEGRVMCGSFAFSA